MREPLRDRPLSRVAGAALLASVAIPTSALAHQAGLSRGAYSVGPEARVDVTLAFARLDLASALEVPEATIHATSDLDALARALEKTFVQGLRVGTSEGSCPGRLARAEVDDQDGVELYLRFDCPASPAGATSTELVIEANFLDALGAGHRHIARLELDRASDEILFTGKSTLRAKIAPMKRAAGRASSVASGFVATTASLVTPIFTIALALPAPRARSAFPPIAATLVGFAGGALAVSRGLAPAPSLVGALGALAVVYVGADASIAPDTPRSDAARAAIGASFGLVLGAHAAPTLVELPGSAASVLFFGAVAVIVSALLRRAYPDGAPSATGPGRRRWITRSIAGLAGIAGVALFVKSIVHWSP